MQKTRITKDDGRYLIFYTFDENSSAQPPVTDAAVQSESQPDQDQPVRNDD